MLVYGDRERIAEPRQVIAALGERLHALAGLPAGLDRHGALVGGFVEASALVQGLADAARGAAGCDARDPTTDLAMAALVGLARAVAASWDAALAGPLVLPDLSALAAAALPATITMRHAEGHAYYALYPEAYLAAARAAVAAAPGSRRVIGLRSIGAGLAAMVAVGTGAPDPNTVRPGGDPFRRTLAIEPALVDAWVAGEARLAVVDEGPGLSGSSFGAVLDLLEDRGVPRARLECYPGHRGGLGPAAAPRHRARWERVARHVVEVDALLLAGARPRLAGWIAARVGPLAGPLEDVSGGAWRARRYPREADWPPAVVGQERRKLLARTADGATWLARFVGLGDDGAAALARARTLHAAGFTPEPAGLCHGFLLERWRDDAAPLDPRTCDRGWLVECVGRYLGFRARALPAGPGRGATLAELRTMIERNTSLALGAEAAEAALAPWAGRQGALAPRPIELDGRLHAWEWLVAPDGALLKTDALDHHAAHDLIGCQDVAWDLAGAAIELGLAPDEEARLAAVVAAHGGARPAPDLAGFLRLAYLAFQLGRHALAADAHAGSPEQARLRAAADGYAATLARFIARR